MMNLKRKMIHTPIESEQELSDMQRHLSYIYLQNPNLNDFQLLTQLREIHFSITLEALRQLKCQSGLKNHEAVCNILLNRLFLGCGNELNPDQLKFIYKIHPELHDRDVRPSQPGEMLVYKCLSGKNVEGAGIIYFHVFADMYNGLIFARMSTKRTLKEAIRILQNYIIPIYSHNKTRIQTVLQTAEKNINSQNNAQLADDHFGAGTSLQWGITSRRFGTIEHFHRQIAISNLFEHTIKNGLHPFPLYAAFAKLIRWYNIHSDFHQQRPLLHASVLPG
ncbi:hypothetical protein [Sporomusa acidovorans]|uniref:Integrase catalytic domain-containing protein n=1 Tax=Sporomusa acidovorans (strain ATCC 49682 / DSM 3132 / Mol) TaxID=1123286 RepID=A0ABZ3J1X0_SPOA4|nr:hypothetical protein [Sporomusa acidovorans]OZC24107.1 hypothetical protein SPACI_02540 [Sporomusa acidovorans DSM 3132]SDF69257.1 hypothetical protein SAMN04488499_106821 [Sporomusa acidovorans]